ncbi:MAG: hypothetical protein A3G49_04150 [Candidatus Sungbacteria bacterium RIFCSPLOWO2_12_FULL_41_11]|uniref:Uncharacterized protein n=1 Tax=Candidatus Sungbacteria bacterium RIFCSPLOWO2_12_FULL_41_11 TaxID=1802286 RepID=A0A1G2LTH6_9BACT|nr:MAG: hypothetical protein UV01_C0010G0036 [Parcubacteria group bacterium GW2011_GWA2_42_14]OGZ99327.1 MAG: hypothetical protein A3D41_02615 [Candidatus Sungbacteria bacterium RIFCSPHIGHO2_02_FULL_41_12b]OHA14853.1 MAG: hypothetical protein A3G49_04150 [Candidatus Sungbacteria bacterium RIFCSPLOWO2_12_FULL_41_11]
MTTEEEDAEIGGEEEEAVAVAAEIGIRALAKSIRRFVPTVERTQRFRFRPPKEDRFTAETVIQKGERIVISRLYFQKPRIAGLLN